MADPRPVERPVELLVEGRDDEVFFVALLEYLQREDVWVRQYGGRDNLPNFLPAYVRTPGFRELRSLGIVRDADANPLATFQSTQDILRNNGLSVPTAPQHKAPGTPATAILILPAANATGMLETLCLQAVAHRPEIGCIDEFFDCVLKRTGRQPTPADKSRVQAYIASQSGDVRLIGEAAKAGYWNWASPVFQHVTAFMAAL